jgi:2-octaprenyl-6-methoxyphenol hydroxylase
MNTTSQIFDVIISGGGLSGSLMALSLANQRKADGSLLSIAIIEAVKDPNNASTKEQVKAQDNKQSESLKKDTLVSSLFDQRVLALSHGSSQYLEKLGVWADLSSHACAIKDIDISDRGHYGKARLRAKDHGVEALGYVIEMALIGKSLQSALKSHKNIAWYFGNTITEIAWHKTNEQGARTQDAQTKGVHASDTSSDTSLVTVTLSNALMLQTSLLLGCDGVNSPCRTLANITTKESDYEQVALIANVSTNNPHYHKAFERFTEEGPIAMLPLKSVKAEHRCSLVWTLSKSSYKKVEALDEASFKKALENAFGRWLGGITHVGKKDSYPLVLLQAEQQTYHRMALIGNASHTIHPIAGQGFNLGLRDVKEMADLITNALAAKKDIGSFSLLNNYAKSRKTDHQDVIGLTDSLVTLFSNNLPPLIVGRSIGLKVLNYLTPLKDRLVNKTMGY